MIVPTLQRVACAKIIRTILHTLRVHKFFAHSILNQNEEKYGFNYYIGVLQFLILQINPIQKDWIVTKFNSLKRLDIHMY